MGTKKPTGARKFYMKKKVKYLIFDFDGVLVESNELRSKGFALLFSNYPSNQVKQFMDFVHENWGLSRHAKIRHFYDTTIILS